LKERYTPEGAGLQKDRFQFNRTTFWKVWLGFLLTWLLCAAGTLWLLNKPGILRNPQSLIENPEGRADTLVNAAEDRFFQTMKSRFEDLTARLSDRSQRRTQIVNNWLSRNPDIISVSYWNTRQLHPEQMVQPGFWKERGVQRILDSNSRILVHFLTPDSSLLNRIEGEWKTGRKMEGDLLGYPIYSMGKRLTNTAGIRAIEVKFRLDSLASCTGESLVSGESIAILDSRGKTVHVVKGPPDSDRNGSMEGNFSTASMEVPLPRLPFTFRYTYRIIRQTPFSIPRPQLFWVLLTGILLAFPFALIWALWVDRPLSQLTNIATEIARGDFAHSIPEQKNPYLNRWVRIFNYMAEETARFKKLDVGEIINEKNKNEAILHHIADAVVVTDAKDRILVINSIAEKWFGLKEREAIARPLNNFIQNEHLMDLLKKVKSDHEDSASEFSFQIEDTHERKVFQAHAARIEGGNHTLLGVVTVIRDVTKEKEADRIKTELVSMVAHELKSPLTSIYGFSELLLDSPPDDPKAKEYARVILNESTRLTDLVNKFLDLSRLEAGRVEVRMNPFDLKQVIQKIIETYQAQTEKKKIKVLHDIDDNIPLALGDQDMIEQVLVNLFSNAIKYSPHHSKIGIEVKEQEKRLVVSVIDNGYGIPQESLPHIFDKFYRVTDSEGTEEVEGSGLGLTLAREIIERHGGTITVNSRLGVGSVFTFSIPYT
jgi:PAS domain S-box-containing protein